MLETCLALLVFINVSTFVLSYSDDGAIYRGDDVMLKTYAIWPNATVPFYVDPQHFDHEQSLSILTALSMFAFKTCLKFKPVMARPGPDEEVMTFINPDGVRRCHIDTKGHSVFNPHLVRLGYECLKSPQIEMMIMKALGFPFEHNRANRNHYITVLFENIEPGHIELFTKENMLPMKLKFLPYDINSVMHFGSRDYSKNGHRTIIFKDPNAQQNRIGLSSVDLKKIETVYGPECRIRDRREKIQLCQSYPGVARRKREADSKDGEETKRNLDLSVLATKSLRVNPDITPLPEAFVIDNDVTKTLQDLGIDQPVQEIVDEIYKVSALALKNARDKYCKNNDSVPKTVDIKVNKRNPESDVLGIVEVVANYAKGMVDDAVHNLTKFCEESETIEVYQRARGCSWNSNDPRCRQTYFKSTKSGPVQYSTNHRPVPDHWPTKHLGGPSRKSNFVRAMNASRDPEETTKAIRRKRDAETITGTLAVESDKTKEKGEVTEEFKAGDANVKEVARITAETGNGKKEDIEKRDGVKEEKANAEEKKELTNLQTDGKLDARSNLGSWNDHRRSNQRTGNYRSSSEYIDEVVLDMSVEMEIPSNINKGINEEKRNNIENRDRKLRESNQRKKAEKRMKQKRDHKIQIRDSPSESGTEGRMERQLANVKQEMPEGYEKRPKRKLKRQKTSSELPRTVQLSEKNEEFYEERRWPEGVLRYTIQEDTSSDLSRMREQLDEVSQILKKRTCVRLKEMTHEQSRNFEDYIVVDQSPDYVTGRVGGEQRFGSVEMFRGGQHRQHTAMMVMAMLGFYFEVSRHDRDKYIRVHMRHVRHDKLHHFEMITSDATLPLPYDYASATHPAWQFWRQIGRTGISTVATFKEHDPNGTIMQSLGQNEQVLSELDIVKINSVYGVDCFHRSKAEGYLNQRHNDSSLFPA